MKNQVFKCVLLLGIALLGFGCSNDSDVKGPVKMISELRFGDSNATTKTTIDGLVVNWADGDKIGIMNINDSTSNYQFLLSSGAGSSTGTFHAVQSSTTDSTNFLAPGTYVAYYPYKTDRKAVQSVNGNTIAGYPAKKDFMMSDEFVVNSDGSIVYPSSDNIIPLHHLFALIQVNLRMQINNPNKDATETSVTLNDIYLQSQDSVKIFASSYKFSSRGEPIFEYEAETAIVEPNTVLTSTSQPFMLFARQNPNMEVSPLQFEMLAKYDDDTDSYNETRRNAYFYFPSTTKLLVPGTKKTINLLLTVYPASTAWEVSLDQ